MQKYCWFRLQTWPHCCVMTLDKLWPWTTFNWFSFICYFKIFFPIVDVENVSAGFTNPGWMVILVLLYDYSFRPLTIIEYNLLSRKCSCLYDSDENIFIIIWYDYWLYKKSIFVSCRCESCFSKICQFRLDSDLSSYYKIIFSSYILLQTILQSLTKKSDTFPLAVQGLSFLAIIGCSLLSRKCSYLYQALRNEFFSRVCISLAVW